MPDFVEMSHPELDVTVTVAEASVATHQKSGWELVDSDEDLAEQEANDLLVEGDDDDHTTYQED